MIRIAELKRGNHAQVNYEKQFADKFKLVENFPNFEKLEQFAQKCVDLHCGNSLNGISARVYMDKIIEMPDNAFVDWAKTV